MTPLLTFDNYRDWQVNKNLLSRFRHDDHVCVNAANEHCMTGLSFLNAHLDGLYPIHVYRSEEWNLKQLNHDADQCRSSSSAQAKTAQSNISPRAAGLSNRLNHTTQTAPACSSLLLWPAVRPSPNASQGRAGGAGL